MQDPNFRRNRLKLVVSTVVLSAVLVVAAVAQKEHAATDPFAPGQTRARTDDRSRPLFGKTPDPVTPELPPASTREEPAPVKQEAEAASNPVPADVLGFLERWRASLASGNVDQHADMYAHRVDRFFRLRRVSRELVRREKQKMMERYPNINKFEVNDVKLESSKGDRAVVTFRKDWDASGRERFAGSERQRLSLQRAGSTWQITGEEELKVYWVNRG